MEQQAEALRPGSILIGWASLGSRWSAEWAAHIGATLPRAQVAPAGRYHRWQDRQAYLLGRLLLRSTLGRAGMPMNLDDMVWSPAGRPSLPGRGDFSITHAGGIVACAWTDVGRVGLDVETERAGIVLGDLLPVFSLAERAIIDRAHLPLRAALRLWCLKEAICKAVGCGITAPRLPECTEALVAFAGYDWSAYARQIGSYSIACAAQGSSPRTVEPFRFRLPDWRLMDK